MFLLCTPISKTPSLSCDRGTSPPSSVTSHWCAHIFKAPVSKQGHSHRWQVVHLYCQLNLIEQCLGHQRSTTVCVWGGASRVRLTVNRGGTISWAGGSGRKEGIEEPTSSRILYTPRLLSGSNFFFLPWFFILTTGSDMEPASCGPKPVKSWVKRSLSLLNLLSYIFDTAEPFLNSLHSFGKKDTIGIHHSSTISHLVLSSSTKSLVLTLASPTDSRSWWHSQKTCIPCSFTHATETLILQDMSTDTFFLLSKCLGVIKEKKTHKWNTIQVICRHGKEIKEGDILI